MKNLMAPTWFASFLENDNVSRTRRETLSILWTLPVERNAQIASPIRGRFTALLPGATPARRRRAHPLDTCTLLGNYHSRCVVHRGAVSSMIGIACSIH